MRLIDADAVTDRYYADYEKQEICDGDEDRDWLKKCIDEAPTIEAYTEADVISAYNEGVAYGAEQAVRHGRWIMRGGKRYCSVCERRACVTRDADDFWYTVGTRHCPNCGAKMDGGADNG